MPPKESQAIEVAIDQTLKRVKQANALHPETDQDVLFYRNYTIAYAYRPEEHLPCALCMKEKPADCPRFMKAKQMGSHCKRVHPKAKVECEYDKCSVLFETSDEKEKHHVYVHVKTYGWWM